jgi:hypothetical protein
VAELNPTESKTLIHLCERFCNSREKNDLIIEALMRKKIDALDLPQRLNDFSEIEIKALEKIVLNDCNTWTSYRGDFDFIHRKKREIWKWLIISLSFPVLSKRREENISLLDDVSKTDLIDNPLDFIKGHWGFVIAAHDRKKEAEPRGKIEHPLTSIEWWEPMTKSDFVWGTATYPGKIRKFLDEIHAKPLNKASGKKGAYFPVRTNLKVLDKWLSDWIDEKEAAKYATEIKLFYDAKLKRIAFEKWNCLGTLEKFSTQNQPDVESIKIPHGSALIKTLSKHSRKHST